MEMKLDGRKYLDYAGHEIHYGIRGTGNKTLVFIHGWTGSMMNWKYQVDAFENYKLILIDLPGHGESSRDEEMDYSMEFYGDCIHEILKAEQIRDAFFIGHSMGFAICEIFIQKYPDMGIGICSMDGSHFELPEDEIEKATWLKMNRDFADSMDEESGREAFLNMLFMKDTPELLKNEVFRISKTVPLRIGKLIIANVEKDLKYWAGNRRSDIPCLAIYSPAYQLPADYELELKRVYPKLEYHYIKDVSHFLMLELPYKVNQIILNYLSKNY